MRAYLLAAGVVPLLLVGCAQRPRPVPLAEAPPPAPVPAPERPADLPAKVIVPVKAADGRYATINRGVSSAGALWHVRSALNVAALGCRGPQDMQMIAAYNALLARQKAPLASADKALRAEFRARDAKGWQQEHDRHLTRLYNFFAQPIATARFCAEALTAANEAQALDSAALAAWAPAALDRLETPFTDGYARYEDWQTRYAAWAAGDRTRYAAAAPAGPRLAYAPMDAVIAWSPSPLRTASLR